MGGTEDVTRGGTGGGTIGGIPNIKMYLSKSKNVFSKLPKVFGPKSGKVSLCSGGRRG